MKVIVGFEVSQVICKAFRQRGHEAYSCDIKPCTGGANAWHLQGDIFELDMSQFDLGIFHPACTHLARSGAKHFRLKRADGRQQIAIQDFMRVSRFNIKKKCLENPVGIMSTEYRVPDQIINPWMFGDTFQKQTCLWLYDLPKLFHAKEVDLFNDTVTHVDHGEFIVTRGGRKLPKWYSDAKTGNKEKTSTIRSQTFPGIATAMAEQWG